MGAARRAAAGALAAAVLCLTGCVGEDQDSDRGNARQGGTMTVARGAAPATLDPAKAVDPETLEALWLVYTPPLTYRRAEGREGTELVPGLAEALPKVANRGRTYSFRLRRGLVYSDGTPLRASDFRRTVERALVLSPEGRRLFGGIVGAR